MFLLTPIYKWLAGLAIVFALIAGSAWFGFDHGVDHQKIVYAEQQLKANVVVAKKNDAVQATADKVAQTQVVYKDRIVTKYQTVTNDVIKYEKTPYAALGLDPEFVRLHNRAAAANDEVQITQPASGTDDSAPVTGVTTGEAIATITRNYERYAQCVRQVRGWQDFYTNIQTQVNE